MNENQENILHMFSKKLNDTHQLRLVILSDGSLNEAELYNSNLRKLGYVLKSTRVESIEELKNKLDIEQYDIALCCFDELASSVHNAIEAINRSAQKIPVIGMLDADSEITAGEILSVGAVDMVLKNDFTHLKLAVKREFQYINLLRANDLLNAAYFESEKRSQTLLSTSHDAIAYVQEGMHVHVNQAYIDLFEFNSLDDILGAPLMDLVCPENHDELKAFMRTHRNGKGETSSIPVTLRKAGDEEFKGELEFTRSTIEGEIGTQVIIRDQVDAKETGQQIDHSSLTDYSSQTDPLTGLYTRQHFLMVLDESVEAASANKEEVQYSLFHIRLENFESTEYKQIPYEIKDALLKKVALQLQSLVQEGETLCRFDDATFSLLTTITEDKPINDYSRKIQKSIENESMEFDGKELITQSSIGICLIDDALKGSHEALERANYALSKALAKGQSSRKYQPKPGELTNKQVDEQWIKRISSALKNDQFIIQYQPIISLSGDEFERYEIDPMLADTIGKHARQSEFIPPALRTGMARGIDRWVIYRALSQIAEKLKDDSRTIFFVPLTEAALNDPELFRWIKQLIQQFKVPPNSIVFQFNEESVIKYLKHARAMVSALRKIDTKVCLANFGTEANPFRLIRHIPVDYLKVHPLFMSGLTDNRENQQVIEAITEKAHRFGQTTIASGIEDAESLSILWGLGIDLVQGDFLQETSFEMNYDFTAMMA